MMVDGRQLGISAGKWLEMADFGSRRASRLKDVVDLLLAGTSLRSSSNQFWTMRIRVRGLASVLIVDGLDPHVRLVECDPRRGRAPLGSLVLAGVID